MLVQNESDTAQEVPTDFRVVDTEGTEFKPIPSNSLFALELGGQVGGNDQLPEPESTAANGPDPGVDGALPDRRERNRGPPLTLHIPSSSGSTGEVELDI